jgi:hypothetical protein
MVGITKFANIYNSLEDALESMSQDTWIGISNGLSSD